jgi:hypothetical protein
MDRYQEEIRRVAAKSVRDLNLDVSAVSAASSSYAAIPRRLSNGSDVSSHGSSSSSCAGGKNAALNSNGIGVNVAMAKMEYLQKVNQLNLSNTLNKSVGGQAAIGGRTISGPILTNHTAVRRPHSGIINGSATPGLRAISKSTSASSLLHGNANYLDNAAAIETRRRASASPQNINVYDRSTIIAASKQATPRIYTSEPSTLGRYVAAPVVVVAAGYSEPSSETQFQPGIYPQLKRASLTNIPIYENLDSYPELPQRGRQSTPPPPPPPYTGTHHIVLNSNNGSRYRNGISFYRSRVFPNSFIAIKRQLSYV